MRALPEFETFTSNETHLVVLQEGLIAVSKVSTIDQLGSTMLGITTGLVGSALGPFGMLLELSARVGELTALGPEKRELELVDVSELLERDRPSAVLHGQVPLQVLQTSGWPRTEWFRPVLVFPRATVVGIRVRWTSTVRWRVSDEGPPFQTQINFWRVPRLRKRLSAWTYPME